MRAGSRDQPHRLGKLPVAVEIWRPSHRRRPVASNAHIGQDVNAVEAIGASEVFFDVQFSPAVNTSADVIERMEQLWASTQ